MTDRYQRRHTQKKRIRYLGAVVLILLAAAMIGIIVFSAAGRSTISYTQTEEDTEASDLVELNGELYVPKKNIETYLFMGIDDPGTVHKREEYDGTGQCDTIILLVRDRSTGTYMTLSLDRNTMMEVKSLTPDGRYLATTTDQLSLAHSVGDGLEISCENVIDAVSNFLLGQKIDGYAAINMGAIGTINHLLGGITVTIQDDFSQQDSSLIMGETVTLSDEQAVSYIRGRMYVGDGKNEDRVRRQNEYMEAAEVRFRELCSADNTFPMEFYEAMSEYVVTNISAMKFSKLAMLMANGKESGSLKLEGETIIGDLELEEFWADQESLEEVIAQLFYKKYK